MLLSDDEEWKLWNAQGIDDMNQAEAIAFARAYAAAILAKLASAELPNTEYAYAFGGADLERRFSENVNQAHAQGFAAGAAAQLSAEPVAFTDADFMGIFVSKDIAQDCGATIELYTRREA